MEPCGEGQPVAGRILIGQADKRAIQVNALNEASSHPCGKAKRGHSAAGPKFQHAGSVPSWYCGSYHHCIQARAKAVAGLPEADAPAKKTVLGLCHC
jgi:hypothetical protein